MARAHQWMCTCIHHTNKHAHACFVWAMLTFTGCTIAPVQNNLCLCKEVPIFQALSLVRGCGREITGNTFCCPAKPLKPIQYNEILKACNFPRIIACLCLEKQLYQVMEECTNRRNLEGTLIGNRRKAAHHFLLRLMTSLQGAWHHLWCSLVCSGKMHCERVREAKDDECFSCSHSVWTQSITTKFKLTSQFHYRWFLLNRRPEETLTNKNSIHL